MFQKAKLRLEHAFSDQKTTIEKLSYAIEEFKEVRGIRGDELLAAAERRLIFTKVSEGKLADYSLVHFVLRKTVHIERELPTCFITRLARHSYRSTTSLISRCYVICVYVYVCVCACVLSQTQPPTYYK